MTTHDSNLGQGTKLTLGVVLGLIALACLFCAGCSMHWGKMT